jgi:hypothetical protein
MAEQRLSTEAIAAIAQNAGLRLNDEQFADLVAAYRLYEPVLARLPRDWPYATEPAHVFDPRSCMPGWGPRR